MLRSSEHELSDFQALRRRQHAMLFEQVGDRVSIHESYPLESAAWQYTRQRPK
jgi:hypothetical protein